MKKSLLEPVTCSSLDYVAIWDHLLPLSWRFTLPVPCAIAPLFRVPCLSLWSVSSFWQSTSVRSFLSEVIWELHFWEFFYFTIIGGKLESEFQENTIMKTYFVHPVPPLVSPPFCQSFMLWNIPSESHLMSPSLFYSISKYLANSMPCNSTCHPSFLHYFCSI